MRAVIVDDEPVARRGLRHLLLGHADVAVVGEARNETEAVRVLSSVKPDLVLLDIQMPGGDGFDVLRQVAEPLPIVIFVTAYDDYAVRAFEAHALDYLVKPVHEARFDAAIERARDRLRSAEALQQAERLGRLLEGEWPSDSSRPDRPADRLVIPGASGQVVVPVTEIVWIEAHDYYAAIHAGAERHLLRESLDSLERRLDPHVFVRVHRSAIVNLAYVRKWRRTGGNPALVLAHGHPVPVSRRRRGIVATALRRFAERPAD